MKTNMKLPFSFALKIEPKLSIQKIGWICGFYLLAIIPLGFLLIHLMHRNTQLENFESSIDHLAIRMERMKDIQRDRNAFMNQYGEVDQYFIDHVVESMVLLKGEVDALKLVYSHPAFQSCANVKNRLEKLTKGKNRIIFSERNREIIKGIEEIELSQGYPVEINTNDLRNILSVVEGVPIGNEKPPIGRPQLVIRKFHLNKKKLAERETYLLEMQLIKRGTLK